MTQQQPPATWEQANYEALSELVREQRQTNAFLKQIANLLWLVILVPVVASMVLWVSTNS